MTALASPTISLSDEELAAYEQLEKIAPRSDRAKRALKLFENKDEPYDDTHGISKELSTVSV